MSVKLLTEHHWEFLSIKEGAQACLSPHLSKCHIVGSNVPWLKIHAHLSPPVIFLLIASRRGFLYGSFLL